MAYTPVGLLGRPFVVAAHGSFVGAASSRDGFCMTNKEAHQRLLRKGRFSHQGYWYFITTSTKSRSPVLSDPGAAKIVVECLKWLDEQGAIQLIAAVVMPDHIHLAARLQNKTLPALMHSFKSFTSKKINGLLGKRGPVWEPQYYDHAIRTEDELRECVDYCLQNPVRKGLVDNFKEYLHWFCAYPM